MAGDREGYEDVIKLRSVEAMQTVALEMFGDELAARENCGRLRGLEAVRYYLICKFNWLPAQVRAMSPQDLSFALTSEMSAWHVPEEFRDLFPKNEPL